MTFRFPLGRSADETFVACTLGELPSTYTLRDGAGLVQLPSGRLLLIGGWNPNLYDGTPADPEQLADWRSGVGSMVTNEVWASDDEGLTWSLLLAHDPSPAASGNPGARFQRGHTMGVLRHGDDVLVIGGDYGGTNGEIWRCTDGLGSTWELVTNSAPTKELCMFASYDGDLYIMGGSTNYADPADYVNSVYRSTNDGVTWSQLGNPPWSARGLVYSPVVHNGLLYVVGGGIYGDSFYNGVFTFNGTTWSTVLTDGHGEFGARYYHNVVSTGTRLWVLCGYGHNGIGLDNLGDVLYSDDDGVNWNSWGSAPWDPSHADSVCVIDGRIIRAMGNGNIGASDRTVYQIAP